MSLAEELKKEFRDDEEEFHVRAPRKYFLDSIEHQIRNSDKHVVRIFDFRNGKKYLLLHRISIFGDVRDAWDNKFGSKAYDIPEDQRIPIDNVMYDGNLEYRTGRLFLSYNNGLLYNRNIKKYTKPELDITECNISQVVVVSDDMFENRMNILKEEGFIVERVDDEEVFAKIAPSCFYNLDVPYIYCEGYPGIHIPVYYVKLP
jgi:hypothetical protein